MYLEREGFLDYLWAIQHRKYFHIRIYHCKFSDIDFHVDNMIILILQLSAILSFANFEKKFFDNYLTNKCSHDETHEYSRNFVDGKWVNIAVYPHLFSSLLILYILYIYIACYLLKIVYYIQYSYIVDR